MRSTTSRSRTSRRSEGEDHGNQGRSEEGLHPAAPPGLAAGRHSADLGRVEHADERDAALRNHPELSSAPHAAVGFALVRACRRSSTWEIISMVSEKIITVVPIALISGV